MLKVGYPLWLLAAFLTPLAAAQEYPARPVRLIVPYAAGGSSDIIARLEESGVPNMVLTHWFGVLAPAGLAQPVQAKLTREITAAVQHPSVVERYKALILEPATLTPGEFRKLLESDLARWGKVVREAGIKVQ